MNRFRNAVLRRCKSLSRVGRPSSAPYSNLRSMSTRDAAAAAAVVDDDDDAAAVSVGGGAVVFVGSSRRRYVISAEHLSHPLIAALIDEGRRKDDDEPATAAVVNCEVVLFDHLLWMLDNAADDDLRGGDGAAMKELAQLYAIG
ncbi:unnamed protein product [Urochloa decumbens]|uniref:Uncharacterized protein n=1 Tax=Urochloa decumbens TaxID=240449 RepID=A0ABC8VJQ2_9POAL